MLWEPDGTLPQTDTTLSRDFKALSDLVGPILFQNNWSRLPTNQSNNWLVGQRLQRFRLSISCSGIRDICIARILLLYIFLWVLLSHKHLYLYKSFTSIFPLVPHYIPTHSFIRERLTNSRGSTIVPVEGAQNLTANTLSLY